MAVPPGHPSGHRTIQPPHLSAILVAHCERAGARCLLRSRLAHVKCGLRAVCQGCGRGSLGGLHPVTLPENTAGAMQVTLVDVLRHSAGAVVGIGIGEPERRGRVFEAELREPHQCTVLSAAAAHPPPPAAALPLQALCPISG